MSNAIRYEVYIYEKKTKKLLCGFFAAYRDIDDAFEQLNYITEVKENETTIILKQSDKPFGKG